MAMCQLVSPIARNVTFCDFWSFSALVMSSCGVHLVAHFLLVLVAFAHVLVRQQVPYHVAYLYFVQVFRLVLAHTAVLLPSTLVVGVEVVRLNSSAVEVG